MIRSDLQRLMQERYDRLLDINDTKGHDYAGDEDALANFKEVGEDLKDISDPAFQAWFVYFSKHWMAIKTFLKEGDVKSEPIDGRLDDCILYLFLLSGLIEEKKQEALLASMQNAVVGARETNT